MVWFHAGRRATCDLSSDWQEKKMKRSGSLSDIMKTSFYFIMALAMCSLIGVVTISNFFIDGH